MIPYRRIKKLKELQILERVKTNELVKPEITCDGCFSLISNSQYFSIPPNLSDLEKLTFIKQLISDRNNNSLQQGNNLAIKCKNCSNSDSFKMTVKL